MIDADAKEPLSIPSAVTSAPLPAAVGGEAEGEGKEEEDTMDIMEITIKLTREQFVAMWGTERQGEAVPSAELAWNFSKQEGFGHEFMDPAASDNLAKLALEKVINGVPGTEQFMLLECVGCGHIAVDEDMIVTGSESVEARCDDCYAAQQQQGR